MPHSSTQLHNGTFIDKLCNWLMRKNGHYIMFSVYEHAENNDCAIKMKQFMEKCWVVIMINPVVQKTYMLIYVYLLRK